MPDAAIAPGDRQARDRTFPPKVLRYSELSRMSSSPLHFKAAYEHPKEPTPGMRFGSLTHALILEGPTASSITVWEGERGAKGWAAFKAEHEGAFIVTREEHTRASTIAQRVREHHIAGRYLSNPAAVLEGEMRWTRNGVDCGGRPDIRSARITDVKLTASASPGWFNKHAIRSAYHAQLAWYHDGARLAGFDEVFMAGLIAVEMREPHDIVCFSADADVLEEGRKLCGQWFERFCVCRDAQQGGHWPGYSDVELPLECPKDVELIYGEEPTETEAT